MKRLAILSAILFTLSVIVNLGGLSLRYALATIPSKPYTFIGATLIQSAQVNADLDPLYGTLNGNIDHTNVQAGSGFYATDIKPLTNGEAIFGGTATTYTFPGLTVSNLTASTPVCTDASRNLSTTNCGNYNLAGAAITPHSVTGFVGVSEGSCPAPYAQCLVSVTFSGSNAFFTSSSSYACAASWAFDGTKNPPTGIWTETISGTSFNIIASFGVAPSAGSYTFPVNCRGT